MCGIAGQLDLHRHADDTALQDLARAMAQRLAHRGPDAMGTWTDATAGLALGHRRLSILDLSPTGAQPMQSRRGRHVLCFNGEIYNFRVLRAELESAGIEFRGHSDTEVLLEAIGCWGLETALLKANGMFALAVWDRETRQLTLARDRLGEKPLYYGWHGTRFLFASELKAFRALPDFAPAIDRDVLSLFLRHGYVPDPHCIHAGFRKLPPGCLLTLADPAAGVLPEPEAWWRLAEVIDEARASPFTGSPERGVDTLEAALKEAVKLRMVADVPLGAFLSGGIDSSTVVALMQAQSPRPVQTFSIGFTDTNYDEAPHARAVARHLGTAHTELYVSPVDAQSVIPRLPAMYDEPFADVSQIPTYLVCALARQQVTVAMSGDGGDELFGGYSRYAVTRSFWARQRHLPHDLRTLLARTLEGVSPARWDRIFQALGPVLPAALRVPRAGEKLHKLARLLAVDDPLAMYQRLIALWQAPDSVVIEGHEPASISAMAAGAAADLELVERMMYIDTVHYLPGDILTKLDRASMAVSLEARVPFLDPQVVALAWRCPLALKLRGGVGKWVLREVLARHVPRALFERPKMGFAVPIDHWLRGPLREWAEDLLAPARLAAAGYLRPEPIQAAWQAHLAGTQNLQYPLWNVLMFEAWRTETAA